MVLGGTTLTSAGSNDVFVAKFNPVSNQFVWAQRAGGTGDDTASGLIVSGASLYVAGTFQSPTAGFGPATLTSAGFTDVFVAKLTDAGNTGSFVWVQRAGGVDYDQAYALAVSGSSVYVAGTFNRTAIFGTTSLTGTGGLDMYAAKLTDAGNTGSFMWAQQASGGTGYVTAADLAVSGSSVYVAGSFGDPFFMSNYTAIFGTNALTGAGFTDAFVAKLTDAGSTGNFVWTQRVGGIDLERATGLAVSGTSVYVAGDFRSSTVGVGMTTLISAGSNDVFVAKLADAGSTGSFVWAQGAGGANGELGGRLVVSGPNLYLAGSFFGYPSRFGPSTITTAGYQDPFVAKLTDAGSTGSFVWAQGAGGADYDWASSLAVRGNTVYVGGTFYSSTARFSAINLLNPIAPNTLGFLAALTDPTLTATASSRALVPAQLFPNPARRTATLRLPIGTTPAPFTLTDALGRAGRHYPAPAGPEATLDLGGLPAGLYLLRGAGPAQRLMVE